MVAGPLKAITLLFFLNCTVTYRNEKRVYLKWLKKNYSMKKIELLYKEINHFYQIIKGVKRCFQVNNKK